MGDTAKEVNVAEFKELYRMFLSCPFRAFLRSI